MKNEAENNGILARIFNAGSIAVIGASSDERSFGYQYIRSLLKFGFKGRLFPVNPKGGTLQDLPVYPSLTDIKEDIDLAVVSVPGRGVPAVLDSCIARGIKAAVVLSAGFRESGDEGRKLEEETSRVISKGIRVIGPNCFGVYCPASGLTVVPGSRFPRESGPLALVSQSGLFSEVIVLQTRGLGIRYSKLISYGNAIDLNEADFFEYLADDPDTKIIAAYIEGVKQGRRFLDAVSRAVKKKPVIIWKSGLTRAGSSAASSHTGSLAGSETIWKAFFAQTGAVPADSVEDMVDKIISFLHLPPFSGRRIALVSGSGGAAVTGADACERWGLELPELPAAVQQKITSLLPPIGTNVRNPVDLANPLPPARILAPVLEAIAASPDIDAIILGRMFLSVQGPSLVLGSPKSVEQGREELRDIPVTIKNKYGKPVILVLSEEVTDAEMIDFELDRRKLRNYYLENGIPVYPTLERAVRAVSAVIGFGQRTTAEKRGN